MRPQVVVPALLVGIGAAIWLLLLAWPATEPPSAPAPAQTVASAPDRSDAAPSPALASEDAHPSPRRAQSDPSAPTADSGRSQTYVEQRIEELRGLGMSGDSASLSIILSELTHRDPRVRRAAVDAAVQFGSRDAIPALQAAWSQTDSPEEKLAIQNAIDFLTLPAMGELHHTSPDTVTRLHTGPLFVSYRLDGSANAGAGRKV